ncbi:ATP-dependent RNA helicase DDX51-like [Mizuhopecten yessoensis]|uniref:ATP-dependent RNA helicase DDX51-like n=1 Tax=Mizuhopecten yessoensis TaxID=6573 RepID=UPI000B45957A|nr:ATP-dependent RNA helicase DDX51-like [Mizuhopecten yessoensis]
MALFSVSRYMGDEATAIDKNQKELTASEILEKIKSEAKQRKAERESKSKKAIENDNTTTNNKLSKEVSDVEDISSGSRKKKKKRRTENETTEVDETSSKKKKKKKHKSDENGEEMQQKTENAMDEEENLLDESAVDLKGKEEVDVGDDTDVMDGEKKFPVLGNFQQKVVQKVNRVLPDWLANPNVITADLKSTTLPVGKMTGLDPDLVVQLQENNISHFFPVQMQVIPMLLDTLSVGGMVGKAGYWPSDICVSAPTGSGKTLAFVLPIIQALKGRVHRQVCALVVLPVKDLAVQVFKVFQTYIKGSDLKVGLLTGQKAFKLEQQTLVRRSLRGYQSLVDIIIATPGRLVDHINQTPGFDLSGLRFLVIDEADKMMELVKQDWLVRVENAVYKSTRPQPEILTAQSCLKPRIPLQKLLFSATLSQNPENLQQLNLFLPKLFTSLVKPASSVCEDATGQSADTEENQGEFVGKYTTPQGLSEYFVECTAATKPLIILHYLHNLMFTNVLCFVNSVESAHRLYHLIRLMGGKEVREFSSGLQTNRRKRILKEFSKGQIDIIICTDAMARGMDIDNVKFVISYDQTHNIKTYIHRVGRTARAGKVGTAITLLQNKEFYHFKKMTREAGKSRIKEQKVSEESLEPIVPAFKKALEEVPQILKAEKIKKSSNG